MNPSPAAELLPESPTSQIPTPIPSPIPKIPTPTQGEILDLEPVGLTLSSEILPAEATIELVLDEACDLTGRVMPDFSGGVVTLDIGRECETPLTGRTQPALLRYTLRPAGLAEGFYILEVGSLRQPFSVVEGGSSFDPESSRPIDSAGTGVVEGFVWHDECQNQPADPTQIKGCIRRGLDDEPVGNGRREVGEEGIPLVVVTLWQNECGQTFWGQEITNVLGHFSFEELPEGVFCVEIDSEQDGNRPLLQPGAWRSPATGSQQARFEVEIDGRSPPNPLMFGWDYSRLPRETGADICQNKGWILEEPRFPAGMEVQAAGTIIKSWTVENIGTCTWTAEYRLALLEDNGVVDIEMASPIGREVAPGERVEIGVNLEVPATAGRWRQRWLLIDDKNNPFGVGLSEPRPLQLDLHVVNP